MEDLTIYPYRKELLKTLKDNRFVMIKHSRQVGASTTLVIHAFNLLISDKQSNIVLISNKLDSSILLLNKIKTLLVEVGVSFIKNTQQMIVLENGSTLTIANVLSPIGSTIDTLLVDNAGFVDLEKIYESFIPNLSLHINSNIVIVSSNKPNSYFNHLFSNDNGFIKITIPWDSVTGRDDKWLREMEMGLADEYNFNVEVKLLDKPVKAKKNKNTISVRINDGILNQLNKRLAETELSLSQYIKQLILKDF
jgi:hypothetical protein